MDKSLWPTVSKIDFIHSSDTWLPTILSRGQHGSAMSLGFLPRLWFCLGFWCKVNFERNLVYLWKSNICAEKLCVRNKRQYPTVLLNWESFRWMLEFEWMDYFLIYGMWWKKCYVHRTAPNHQPITHQETVRARTNPTRNQRETEMLINCRMWTTLPQKLTLL